MEIRDQLPPHTVTDLSADYLPLSEAVNRLTEGMWGGVCRAQSRWCSSSRTIKMCQWDLALGGKRLAGFSGMRQ